MTDASQHVLPTSTRSLPQCATATSTACSPFRRLAATTRRVRVDGQPGAVAFRDENPYSPMSFTVANGKVVAIDILVDRERIRDLDLSAIADAPN